MIYIYKEIKLNLNNKWFTKMTLMYMYNLIGMFEFQSRCE